MPNGQGLPRRHLYLIAPGHVAADVEKDAEGLQTMRNLGRNMAFLIKAIASAKAAGGVPQQERGVFTNFIRE